MLNPIMRAVVCAALTGVGLGVAAPALAELGGTPTPPPSGATVRALSPVVHAQSGVASAASAAAYSVTQTTLASGDIVREYVSTAGTVFGIAWRGPMMPDLPTLLGAYFTQYDSARVAQRTAQPGRGPLNVQLPGLVVRSGGHMGAFSGQAYLPQSLPAGVSAADIQ
jgi:cell division septation protein DedD